MKTLLLAPVTIGFGFGIGFAATAAWGATTDLGRRWRAGFRQHFGRTPGLSAFRATSAHEIEWSENQQHRDLVSFFMKPLCNDPQVSHVVMLVRYPAGEMNPDHTHPIGHGLYVLSGNLVTHRGTFGRDTFVWFPPDETMAHGAGPDEDMVAIFLTGRNMQTHYDQHQAGAVAR